MTLTEVSAGSEAIGRRCAFRRCSAPLPPPTGRPGNRPKYCQDGRTWGPQALSCKSAESAYLAVASLQGEDPLPPAGVTELADRLAAAAAPLRDLLDTVLATRSHLEQDVVTAHAERDEALIAAATDRGDREAAETASEQARAAADTATRQAAAAGEARDAAEVRARDAERELLRGEGRLAALADRLHRAEALTDEASVNAARLDAELADALATLRARDDALQQERARNAELRQVHRAELAARDVAGEAVRAAHERRFDELRGAHLAELDRLRTDHDADLDQREAAHTAALATARRTAEAARVELDERHASRLAELHHSLGAVTHERDRLAAELARSGRGRAGAP